MLEWVKVLGLFGWLVYLPHCEKDVNFGGQRINAVGLVCHPKSHVVEFWFLSVAVLEGGSLLDVLWPQKWRLYKLYKWINASLTQTGSFWGSLTSFSLMLLYLLSDMLCSSIKFLPNLWLSFKLPSLQNHHPNRFHSITNHPVLDILW